MTLEEIYEVVVAACSEISGIEPSSPDEPLDRPMHEGGMGLDLMDQFNLLFHLEQLLGIDTDEERLFRTPREIAVYLKSLNPERRQTAWDEPFVPPPVSVEYYRNPAKE